MRREQGKRASLNIAVEVSPLTGRRSAGRFVSIPYRTRRRLFLAMMAAPAVLYVVLVALWPLCQGIYYSFYDYNLIRPASRSWEGLGNYVRLWSDDTARRAILNTFVFSIGAVALEFVLGLAIAFLLWRDDLFNRICLSLLLIPATVTPLVVGLIFKAMLNADYGVIGYFLTQWGVGGDHGLLGETSTALAMLIVIDAWEWTPLMTLILLAGLKSLPTDIIEAAEVDGAWPWQRLRMIILPLLLPSAFLALVLRMMDTFRVFDIVFVTTAGGPGDATNTLMVYSVKEGLQFFNIGFASAIANVTTLCIGIMAAVFILVVRPAGERHG